MKKFPLIILAVLSSLMLLSSCLNDPNNTTQPQSGAFLVAQVSPTAPTLSFYFNSTSQILDTFNFGKYTNYVGPVTPGTYDFMVDSFGTTTPTKLKSTVTIEPNKYYSYFIIDSFSKLKAAFVNDVFKAPSPDSVYVRFFNFCPNATSPLSLVNTDGDATWFDSRTFNDQANNPQYAAFNEVPKGTYTFEIHNATDSVLKSESIILTGGNVYTLFAKGIIGRTDTTGLSIGQLVNYIKR
jgi:uncharacterized protein DUF4397